MDQVTADTVGDLASLIPTFERSLRAANKSPKTIQVYAEAARQLLEFLRGELSVAEPPGPAPAHAFPLMGSRRASDKQVGELISAVKRGGWTVTDPLGKSNIYKAKCGCGAHLEHIHSTPSGPNYAKNKVNHMKNLCWTE